MSNYTPGPWRVSNGKVTKEIQVWSHVKRIAECSVSKALGYPEIKANAQLISAAPDLLAVVKELEESADYWGEYDVPLGIVDRIRAAIAKAEGAQ